ncbi:MAG: hypothetical protein IT449_01185 [Phycisphaerales bacterium]|nr:hypothetical protein [Phycisphaerales bacterium]
MNTKYLLIVMTIVCSCLVAPALGDRTFDGQVNDQWDVDENWNPNTAPGEGDVAIIPTGFNVKIDVTTAKAKSIQIAEDSDLSIERGGILTLHGNGVTSLIGGDLKFAGGSGNDPILHFKYDHTLSTVPNELIPARQVIGDVQGVIRGDSGKVLTLAHQGNSRLQLTGTLLIEIALVNNEVVNGNYGTISLSENAKSGSGLWKATQGELTVNVEVTGVGTWEVGAGGTIEVNVDLEDIAGPVHILNGGELLLNASLCSPGALDFEEGVIQVGSASPALTFYVGGTCPT